MSTTILSPLPLSPASTISPLELNSRQRNSIISSSEASYDTAPADPVASIASESSNGDIIQPQYKPLNPPPINPIHLIATNQANTENVVPIHITRVSHDTVHIMSEGTTMMQAQARVADAGRTVVHGMEAATRKATTLAGHIAHPSPVNQGQKHRQHTVTMRLPQNSVVEGPNGLTPPPSPRTPGGLRETKEENFTLSDEKDNDENTIPNTPRKSTENSQITPRTTPTAAWTTAQLNQRSASFRKAGQRRGSDTGSISSTVSLTGPIYASRLTREPTAPSSFPSFAPQSGSPPNSVDWLSTNGGPKEADSLNSLAGPSNPGPSAHRAVSGVSPSDASPTPPKPSRRNTTGSGGDLSHSRSRSVGEALPTSSATANANALNLRSHSRDGRDFSLDDEILKEADQIRKERNTRRARAEAKAKAQADAEAEAKLPGPQGPPRVPHGPESVVGADDDDVLALTTMSKKKVEEENNVLVGKLIGEDHVNYVLMYNMLTGIRIGVSRCEAKVDRPLLPDDYTASHKYSFDIVGNELTPSARYDFKFKDYAPWVFRHMRAENFHLDPADYLLSLTSKYILSELGSPGKSGSFFYFSSDYRFIIKTIHHNEHKFLRKILPLYHHHVQTNPQTLLSRFYGLHRVKLPRGKKIHFVIMNNLFPPHRDIHETYDLKGSTVGREYPEARAKDNPKAVLKDLNWINRGKTLELGPENRALLTEQLRRDSEFLGKVDVMDYSLLIGVHNMERGNRDNLRRNTLKVFQPDLNRQNSMVPNRRRRGSLSSRSDVEKPYRRSIKRGMSTGPDETITQNMAPQPIGSLSHEMPDLNSTDRQNYIFYQDEGGFRGTDDANNPMDQIYYLGIIDILTPYNTSKKLEHIWKGLQADKHKISPVPSLEYSHRFFDFMKSIMRGGGGAERFKAE